MKFESKLISCGKVKSDLVQALGMTKGTRRCIQCFDAEADDELSLKIGQIVTIIAIEDNGWAEGILDNQWVGWFPIQCVVEDTSTPPANASEEKLQQMRLDNLFKNADILDGAVNKKDFMALTVMEKLQMRFTAILDFMECEAHFVNSMNAWMAGIEDNSVFSLLSNDQGDTLLEALDDVVNFHQVLFGSLDVVRRADPSDQMFGGYFLDFVPFFSEVYLKLKSLLPQIVTCLVDSNKSQHLDMASILSFSAEIHLPVQHVTKMLNYTRRILNLTPLDHEDWTFTMYSWRSLRDAVKKIDQEVREIETKEALNTFLDKLDGYDGPPIESFGQLVRYGTIRIGVRRQIFHIYLLEQKLFILKSVPLSLSIGKKHKRDSLSSATKFVVEYEILLDSLHLKSIATNSDLGDDFFRISYFLNDKSIRSIDCYALNKEIKKVWVDLLNALVAKQDERLLQAEKSKANVDELYKDLMSFIENHEATDLTAPPLPPKDNLEPESRNSKPSNDDTVPSLSKDITNDLCTYSSDSVEHGECVELDVPLDPDPFIDGEALMGLNIQESLSDEKELEPHELIRENPLNVPPPNMESESFDESTTLFEEKEDICSKDEILENNVDRVSDEPTPEPLATNVHDEEYTKLLMAYREKVDQIAELKRRLAQLSKNE